MASTRRKKTVLLVLVVAAAAAIVVGWQWYPIRVRIILAGGTSDGEKAQKLGALGSEAIPALIGYYESSSGEWAQKMSVGPVPGVPLRSLVYTT